MPNKDGLIRCIFGQKSFLASYLSSGLGTFLQATTYVFVSYWLEDFASCMLITWRNEQSNANNPRALEANQSNFYHC
jgi:hypothetical protein